LLETLPAFEPEVVQVGGHRAIGVDGQVNHFGQQQVPGLSLTDEAVPVQKLNLEWRRAIKKEVRHRWIYDLIDCAGRLTYAFDSLRGKYAANVCAASGVNGDVGDDLHVSAESDFFINAGNGE
jgi:hypothetical protein